MLVLYFAADALLFDVISMLSLLAVACVINDQHNLVLTFYIVSVP